MIINKKARSDIDFNKTFTDNILLTAALTNEDGKNYIVLQHNPKAVILSTDDGNTAKVDFNPVFVSGKYEVASPFTKVYYVPGDAVTAERAVINLGLEQPLNPSANIGEYFDLLSLKLAYAERSLSVWDTYNIYKVAYNLEELSSALASLPLSSSILVNIESAAASVGSWQVKKGDMICRDSFGALHHIQGSNGGYYFPSKIKTVELSKNNSDGTPTTSSVFQLGFQFSTATPKEGSSNTIVSGVDATTAYQQMSVQFPEIENMQPALCYASSGTIAANTAASAFTPINFLTTDSSKEDAPQIQPVVYYYLLQGGQEERVYLPVDYHPSSSSFRLYNPTKMSLKYEVR